MRFKNPEWKTDRFTKGQLYSAKYAPADLNGDRNGVASSKKRLVTI
jgi:hypothetical protein